MWFDGWNDIVNVLVTGTVCLLGLIAVLRVAGKRTLAKMNAFDFVFTVTIGSTLATTVTQRDTTVSEGMTALALIVFLQYAIAWLQIRSDKFQKIIKSQPAVLFHDGEFKEDAMREERISRVEVLAALRYNGLTDPSQAHLVLIETDGELSVIPKRKDQEGMAALKPAESFSPDTRQDLQKH